MKKEGCKDFETTVWSLVEEANGSSEASEVDLNKLCQSYWFPLYAFIRRRGYPPAEAEDLTQGFLAAFLQRHSLASADRTKGRLRSLLLASLRHYLSNEREREN